MATFDLNTAKQKVTDFTTKKFGRGPQNDQEWGAIAQGINFNDGVDDNELNQAFGNAERLAASLGASPQPAPQPAPSPGTVRPGPQPGMQIAVSSPSTPAPAPANTGAVPPTTPAPNPMQQQTQSALQALLARGQQTPSLADPTLAPQMDAFRAMRQRAAERQRSSAAERAAQTGTLNSGGFDTTVAGIEAQRGLDEANFGAGLLGQEQTARRAELMQALQLAAQMGDAEAARELQRMSLDLNRTLGTGDLDLRNRALTQQGQLGRGSLGLDLLRALMQNDQFFSGLGLNAAQLQAMLNQNAVSQLLGGF
jgi:hypothetical protein